MKSVITPSLTIKIRKKLVSGARCAIRMRSKEADTAKALKALRRDLANGPFHVFGIHTHCSHDFSTTAQQHQHQDRDKSQEHPDQQQDHQDQQQEHQDQQQEQKTTRISSETTRTSSMRSKTKTSGQNSGSRTRNWSSNSKILLMV